MRIFSRGLGIVACGVVLSVGSIALAQPLGAFRWQLQPYCNTVSVTVTQAGAVYTLDGFDDQCGAATRAPLVGLATPNPDGTIGFGLNISTSTGQPVQVAATITLAGLNGTWHDSAGQSGTFAFGGAAAGSPRPPVVPGSGGVSKAYVDAADALGAAHADAGDAALRTDMANGDAAAQSFAAAGDAATLAAARAADANVLALIPPTNQFLFNTDGGFLAKGTFGVGAIPAQGQGVRLMWYPGKAALRAGRITQGNDSWDDAKDGSYSMAAGLNATASGQSSLAIGDNAVATLGDAVAIGPGARAVARGAIAIGENVGAAADNAVALGTAVNALGNQSIALGFHATTSVNASGTFVFGDHSTAQDVSVTGANEFVVRAAGGTTFYSNAAVNAGVRLPAGGGAWVNLSDVARKQSFTDLDGETVLGKLRTMPIREWSYIAQGDGIRHVGPTAQDFRAAFGLGEDPLGISTVDADGIALAGVKALEARTAALADENAALRAELAALRALVATRASRRR